MHTRRVGRLSWLGLLVLASASAFAADPTASDPPWEPGKKGEGRGYTYQVFSQQKEGEPFVRYRVRGTIDATPEVLQRTADEISIDPAHSPKDQKSEVISKTDTETVIHTSIELPVMFTNRDVVTRGVSSADAKTGVRRIDFKSVEVPSVPPKPGIIRLTNTGGFWEFVPDGQKRSKVTFETYVDLGGSLPGWLVSGIMASTAIGNYEGVAKEAVRSSLYSSALIRLPLFTSGSHSPSPAAPGARAPRRTRDSSPRAERGAPTEGINSKSLWGAFQDRAGEEISGQAWSRYPRDRGESKHLQDRQTLGPAESQNRARRTVISLFPFGGPNSLFSRINSLFAPKNSLFLCAGNFRVSARKYVVNSA
jgi:hypothetical protein